MRLIIPFASAYSAVRGIYSRSMTSVASVDHSRSDTTIRNFLKEVYQKSHPRNVMSVFITGGGTTSLEWLFTVPGASGSLMDAGVVYSRSALEKFIQSTIHDQGASACSSATALAMADSSWTRANELLLAESRDFNDLRDVAVFGVSCSASLLSDIPKKGPHRVFVASTTQTKSSIYTIELQKGYRSRVMEDAVCSRLLLEAIARASGVEPLPSDYLIHSADDTVSDSSRSSDNPVTESVLTHTIERKDILDRICRKEVKQALFVKRLRKSDSSNVGDEKVGDVHEKFLVLEDVPLPKGTLVFPGSFNPLHEGHIALVVAGLRKIASATSSSQERIRCSSPQRNHREGDDTEEHEMWRKIPIVFEISAVNADKPPLPREEIVRRIDQFDPFNNPALRAAGLTNIAVCVTSEPLFLQKSKLFADCNFLIGSDTMARIINPKYYSSGPAVSASGNTLEEGKAEERREQQQVYAMVSALSAIADRGCKFIVGGRLAGNQNESEACFETLQSVSSSSRVDLPMNLINSLFEGLSEDEFRVDLSSTQIRNQVQG